MVFEDLTALLAAMAVAVVMVAVTILIHYEALRIISDWIDRLDWAPPRRRLLLVIFACFGAHTVEVWVWAVAYDFVVGVLKVGRFAGEPLNGLDGYLYFSVVTYTSLGFGDALPVGGARLLAGVEALVGLLLIGWSASFTYLAMEKLWDLHPRRGRRKGDKGKDDKGGEGEKKGDGEKEGEGAGDRAGDRRD
ncbi:MAG TPA: potassium channel family protein [Alphaproteobacteria bacterium]|nr:potassium channel family protein [Alphaproteobacteria bacterium]